jgi:NIMA (never in mitosis gene a)-related kinase
MVTLKHAFDANSMKGLVLKILRGSYPPIPDMYSNEMRGLIAEMLNKDPKKRPSVKKILEKDFLAERIASLIPMSIVKQELGNTFVNKQQNKNKDINIESTNTDSSSIALAN